VSPSGDFLVAAVDENINIWNVGTGALLGVVTRHYQKVTVLQFTGDSTHLVSGGADGQVLVWAMVLCVARRSLPGQDRGEVGTVEPRYTWTDHALPVTGLHVSQGPAHGARIISSSMDMTVKVYTMTTGQLLLSVSFTSPITAVSMDNMETKVYAGTKTGQIHSFSLLNPPRDVAVTVDSMDSVTTMLSHTGEVTRLSLSMDGYTLASGGQDSVVHLWDTPSGQVVRTLPHKGCVTHVQFIPTPPALIDHDKWNPARKLVALQKGTNQSEFSCALLRKADMGVEQDWMKEDHIRGGGGGGEGQVKEEEHTVQELKQINNQLYKFAMKNILHS